MKKFKRKQSGRKLPGYFKNFRRELTAKGKIFDKPVDTTKKNDKSL